MDWLYWALFFAAAFAALLYAVVRDGPLRAVEPEATRARRKTPAPIEPAESRPRVEPSEGPVEGDRASPEPAGEPSDGGELAAESEASEGQSEPPSKPESEGERNT